MLFPLACQTSHLPTVDACEVRVGATVRHWVAGGVCVDHMGDEEAVAPKNQDVARTRDGMHLNNY